MGGKLAELPPGPDPAEFTPRLVSSASTITTAIHLAALMGAHRILLVGHDLGSLDGEMNIRGYHDSHTLAIVHNAPTMTAMQNKYTKWLTGAASTIEQDTLTLRRLLRERYPYLHIHTLSPFIGLRMEGHHAGDFPPNDDSNPSKNHGLKL